MFQVQQGPNNVSFPAIPFPLLPFDFTFESKLVNDHGSKKKKKRKVRKYFELSTNENATYQMCGNPLKQYIETCSTKMNLLEKKKVLK